VVLLPGQPQVVATPPYEPIEVLIPLSELQANEDYWVRASYPGSSSSDIIMKRKNMDYTTRRAKVLADSDYAARYSKNFSRRLSDHRHASEFSLNAEKLYVDDPEGITYEIREIENEKFLVLFMTVLKVSMAMDEAMLYDEVPVALELMSRSISGSSKLNSLPASLLLSIIVLFAFFAFIYIHVLPRHIKNSVLPLAQVKR
jgi:hypothetical protein